MFQLLTNKICIAMLIFVSYLCVGYKCQMGMQPGFGNEGFGNQGWGEQGGWPNQPQQHAQNDQENGQKQGGGYFMGGAPQYYPGAGI